MDCDEWISTKDEVVSHEFGLCLKIIVIPVEPVQTEEME